MQQPNIILIFVDNQPAKMLGCAGNDEIFTPNLDKLASNGIRFSEAFCPNAMCSPCRASVLTGLMPSQHGIHTWLDDELTETWPKNWNAIEEFDSLPKILSRHGYDTSLIGKYHLGIADEPQNGFDNWVTFQIGHVLSFYDCQMIDNGNRFTYPGHSVDFFTQRAVDYVEERGDQQDTPFFLYLTYPAPYGHWPSIKGEPQNKFAGHYRDTPFQTVPREGISEQLVDWVMLRHERADDFEFYRDLLQVPNDLPTLRNYYSQMSMVDDGVGRVLDTLDSTGQSDNTLVVYTSDHGMSLGEHGFWGHGEDTWPSNTFREANNIPLIIRPPAPRSSAKVVDRLVGTTNIFSTILDYAGTEASDAQQMEAKSIRGLVEGDDIEWDDVVFMEQEETRSIRTPQWLFMKRFAPSPYDFGNELYDLINDPLERNNIADDPAYTETVAALSDRVDAFFAEHCNPKWDLWSGGVVKSNSSRPFLWQDVWGDDWSPDF